MNQEIERMYNKDIICTLLEDGQKGLRCVHAVDHKPVCYDCDRLIFRELRQVEKFFNDMETEQK